MTCNLHLKDFPWLERFCEGLGINIETRCHTEEVCPALLNQAVDQEFTRSVYHHVLMDRDGKPLGIVGYRTGINLRQKTQPMGHLSAKFLNLLGFGTKIEIIRRERIRDAIIRIDREVENVHYITEIWYERGLLNHRVRAVTIFECPKDTSWAKMIKMA